MLWDQGEANYGDNCLTYGCKLSALAYDWRTNLFNQPDILFTFDQLRADAMAQGTGTPSYADAIPHSTFSSRVDLQTCFANDTSSGHAIRKLEVRHSLRHALFESAVVMCVTFWLISLPHSAVNACFCHQQAHSLCSRHTCHQCSLPVLMPLLVFTTSFIRVTGSSPLASLVDADELVDSEK